MRRRNNRSSSRRQSSNSRRFNVRGIFTSSNSRPTFFQVADLTDQGDDVVDSVSTFLFTVSSLFFVPLSIYYLITGDTVLGFNGLLWLLSLAIFMYSGSIKLLSFIGSKL